jgi:Histidine kinase-, DNA gyrase B-, and HSP90-like ATPase
MSAVLNRTTLHTSRLLDFASEKELVAQAGHQTNVWPIVILKELVDNAIDAAEEAEIAPRIKVTVDRSGITVEDNGPGIPPDVVEDILDFSVRGVVARGLCQPYPWRPGQRAQDHRRDALRPAGGAWPGRDRGARPAPHHRLQR